MFLTQEELFELTGYRRPSKQVAHLRLQRVPFHLDCHGKPKVVKSALEAPTRPTTPQPKKSWSPTWGASQPSI